MIGQECIDELADFAGLKAHVAAITERAMRGEIEFEPALRERVALLKGLPVSGRRRGDREAHHADAGRPRPGRDHARATAPTPAWSPAASRCSPAAIAAMIGFDENRANMLLVDATARFSGLVGEPILGREAKLATLIELRERLRPVAGRHAGDRRRRQRSFR